MKKEKKILEIIAIYEPSTAGLSDYFIGYEIILPDGRKFQMPPDKNIVSDTIEYILDNRHSIMEIG